MTERSSNPAIDPFAAEIVTDPREIESVVQSYNQDAFDRVVSEFDAVVGSGRKSGHSAILVLSDAGYGKSHLVGRLFEKLDDDATLVYLRPFQDPSSCWIAILEKVVAELDYPDAPNKRVCDPGELTQLDTLARRVLLAVVTRLLKDGKLAHPNKAEATKLFESHPNVALDMPGWRNWMQREHEKIIAAIDAELQSNDVQLQPNRRAWLKVLFSYAYSTKKPEIRQLCLDWLTGRPLETDEAKRLQLRSADLPETDLPYEQRNERAFERLRDLFAVGAFYRPFLLCFDQTELYGNTPQLARSFGVVLSRLRRETVNQLVVVTANPTVWDAKLEPHFERADAHAIHPMPVQLSGMTREQAVELVRNRFQQWEVERDPAEFIRGSWFSNLFRKTPQRGARDILREARKAWSGAEQTPNLDEIFESHRRKLLATPKAMDYDPGVLQWAVTNVFGPAVKATTEEIRSPKGYLTVRWSDRAMRSELFGFESGSNWKRWEAILREAERYHLDRSDGSHVRSSFLRLAEQRELPARVRDKLEPRSKAARLVTLDLNATASLFAAHDLWADVEQQNHALGREDVMAFLRSKLLPLAQLVWAENAPIAPPVPVPEPTLEKCIEDILRAKRFITLELLLKQLPTNLNGSDQTVVLTTARGIKSVRVHAAPGSTVLQWLQSA